jgi:hypothetical protein
LPETLSVIGEQGEGADTRKEQMGNLHAMDRYGIGRATLLEAIKVRAATGDDGALADIQAALEDLDRIVAMGDWFGLVRTAFWLVERAEGR